MVSEWDTKFPQEGNWEMAGSISRHLLCLELDDLRIYDRVLSDAEVQALMP